MNAARRKEIDSITAAIEEIKNRIEAIEEEERDYFENMPESFQDGDKGQAAEARDG
jgi:uncharacterized coiled-coil DUF342 family protein